MAYKKSPFKMMPKSPVLKALIGKQKNLNEGLKAAIMASPAKQKQESTGSKSILPKQESTGSKSISPAKAHCKSPVKQKMEMVEVNGKKVPKFAADGKGAGDLKKGSPAKGYKSDAQRKAVHASKADGGKGAPAKQMSKLKKSPAKKYKSPAKQAKSKKEMKYDKTAQKAENAAVKGKVRKNSRLVNKANKMNKKNNLGKGKIAKM